ncbi:MAG TPA: ABC-type transport auxiliary lipoprotein family protein [Terriglobia bacterium]|nr:ABC-type transport auxiliary lipoprotein family protein [Terriglobia bacterium]
MRRTMMAILPVLAAGLGACGGGPMHPMHFYSLTLPSGLVPSATPFPVTLLVGHIQAPPMLRGDLILFRTGANEVDTYPYRRWAAPPAEMVDVRLLRMLRGSGKYQSVTDLGSSARGDYIVRGRLDGFEEVDSGAAIEGRVILEVELFDEKTDRTVWSQSYSHDEASKGRDVADVVAALDRNLQQGLETLTAGMDEYFAKNLKAK